MIAKIEIETKTVVDLLAELEYLVVSIDRIGSADLSRESRGLELEKFLVDAEIFSRLALMRRALAESLDEGLSAEERELIEERIEQVKPWALSR